jgi:hypothetical protein
MLVTEENLGEIEDYILRSSELGIKRIVVRKLKGREEEFPLEQRLLLEVMNPLGDFGCLCTAFMG